MKKAPETKEKSLAARKLLAWYDRHARVLPWRARKGERADPYAVWLSEIMLQQTTVATVGPYFTGFLKRWPTVEALAKAPQEEVMKAWAGLGYYSRARNLHACARTISSDHGGKFPEEVEGLIALPGIGPYTAAAIAAIAFGRPATVVDGNVERVVARLFDIETPLPKAKPEIRKCAETLTPARRAGDFAQAMMDLGATLCTARNPACNRCPINDLCDARARGTESLRPGRAPKKAKPTRQGACFWLTRNGHVWLRRRPEKGLLGGMMEAPGTDWKTPLCQKSVTKLSQKDLDELYPHAPVAAEWRLIPGLVTHSFTHFDLELVVLAAATRKKLIPGGDGHWVPLDELHGEALPTVMRKVAMHAMPEAGPLFARR
ncbi:MAG: A/G-specific adenine glycosylase [Parvibaculum sp.]